MVKLFSRDTLTFAFGHWDRADYLKTEEDPGDDDLIRRALGSIARARGMSQLARATDLAFEGLYRAL